MKIVINGANGKMGKTLMSCAGQSKDISVIGEIDVENIGFLADITRSADVALDFSVHEATVGFARICARYKVAMVIGTTGHDENEQGEIYRLSHLAPIVKATNFSTGVNTLFWLTRKVAKILGPDYDLEVVEMHHRHKKDAPSGTAHTLAKILAETRQKRLDEVVRNGRAGIVGARTDDEIGIHSIRGGDVVGDHTVIFANDGERVELTHKASSRETFAKGALRAAEWVIGKRPGLYDMQDVLGLK